MLLLYVFSVKNADSIRLCLGQKPPIFWWDYLLQDPLRFQMSQLYLASKADTCVDIRDIQEMVTHVRKENSVRIAVKVFEDSLHVSHFDKYPEEYADEVKRFVQSVIKNK